MTRVEVPYGVNAMAPAEWRGVAELPPVEVLDEGIERAPLMLVAFIGVFATSTLIFGDHPRLSTVPYALGIASAIFVGIMYLRMSLAIPIPVYLYGGWVLWMTVGCVLAENREVAISGAITVFQFLVMVFTFATMCQDSRSVWIVAWFLVLGALLNVAAMILTGNVAAGGRATGLLADPNMPANYIGIAICVCWGSLPAIHSMLARLVIIGLILVLHYGLIQTGSRGGAVATAAMTMYMIWHYRRQIVRHPTAMALLVLGVVSVMTVLPTVLTGTVLAERMEDAIATLRGENVRGEGSTSYRLELKQHALKTVVEHPIFGVGMRNFRVVGVLSGQWTHATHDNYLMMMVETGVPGFLLYYSIYVYLWRRLSKLRKSPLLAESERYLISMCKLFLIYLCCRDVFTNTTWSNKAVWVFMALIAGFVQGLHTRTVHRRAALEEYA